MFQTFRKNRLVPGYLIVNSGERWSISKRMYEKAAFNYPMIYIMHEPKKQGKSFVSQMSLSEKSTGLELVSSERQLIYIDLKARRSVPIPESSDIFKVPESEKRFQVLMTQRPSKFCKTTRVAQFSDYDDMNHVTSTAYIRWMIDAASEAAAKGELSSFRQSFDHCAEMVEVLYKKECFAGDIVDIYLWEESPMCLCFNIEKPEGQLGTFGRIRFYNDLFQSRI